MHCLLPRWPEPSSLIDSTAPGQLGPVARKRTARARPRGGRALMERRRRHRPLHRLAVPLRSSRFWPRESCGLRREAAMVESARGRAQGQRRLLLSRHAVYISRHRQPCGVGDMGPPDARASGVAIMPRAALCERTAGSVQSDDGERDIREPRTTRTAPTTAPSVCRHTAIVVMNSGTLD